MRYLATGVLMRLQRMWHFRRTRSQRAPLPVEEIWRIALEMGPAREQRHVLGLIPASSRCKMCNAPFDGIAGIPFNILGSGRSSMNPQWCKGCMENTPTGGAEVELSLLFADIRGSTTLAEGISASEYARLLNRFYAVATNVMVATDALIDKFVGDEVIGLYVPGFAGREHARLALQAARDLLHATGHGDSSGPWIPVGAGVHTGRAFVGKVGSEGVTDITALGDAVNIAARLASQAKAGEILVSESTYHAAGLTSGDLERRNLYLKGRSEPVDVRVLKVAPA